MSDFGSFVDILLCRNTFPILTNSNLISARLYMNEKS